MHCWTVACVFISLPDIGLSDHACCLIYNYSLTDEFWHIFCPKGGQPSASRLVLHCSTPKLIMQGIRAAVMSGTLPRDTAAPSSSQDLCSQALC